MAKKIMPVFRFTDGNKENVTWYTTKEYKQLNKKEIKKMTTPKQKFTVDIEKQKEQYNFLVDQLLKECETKNGYIGVEYDNIYIENLETIDDTMTDILFHRILIEMESLNDHGHELVRDEYDNELPFRSEYNVKQHVKRLGKFIVKYAPQFFNEEQANRYIKEVTPYIGN